jgi:hypothetical protein
MEELTPFQKFKQGIIDILKVAPEKTSVILQKIKNMYPEECHDEIRCIHKNVDYGRPEWEHIVRSAQQALKKSGIIELNHGTKNWELKIKKTEEILKSVRDIEEAPGIPTESEELEEFVGEPIDLGFMRWSPITHDAVIALFVGYRNELDFPIIEWIRPQFPDACVFQRVKKIRASYVRKYIEFELLSSLFKEHTMNPKHKGRKCDYVICWENDWEECPVPVIELRTEIPKILREVRRTKTDNDFV